MNIYKNGIPVDEYVPTYSNRKIVIGIDSSKSNSAIAVADEFGNILDDYEIDGAGGDIDVYDLCAFTRTQLKSLFRGADILLVGIEDIITKNYKGFDDKGNDKNYKGSSDKRSGKKYSHVSGLDVHHSRHVITAVFDNFIFLFEEFFGIRPIRINNWDWKVGILPEQYRTREHHKGSQDWFNDLGNRWAGRKDDVTDVVCITLFLFKKKKIKAVYEVKETAPATVAYKFAILPISYPINDNVKEFVINNTDSIEHNLDAIANRSDVGRVSVVKVKLSSIPMSMLYSGVVTSTQNFKYNRYTEEVLILLERK